MSIHPWLSSGRSAGVGLVAILVMASSVPGCTSGAGEGGYLDAAAPPDTADSIESTDTLDTVDPPDTLDTIDPPDTVDTIESPDTLDTIDPTDTVDIHEPPDTTDAVEAVDTLEPPDAIDDTPLPCPDCDDGDSCSADSCEDGICVPDCEGKDCGADGCGGTCGSCSGYAGVCTAGTCGPPAAPDGTWRSLLYPADWTPAHTTAEGHFLHDFSFAGYHNSEIGIPSIDGPVFDVVTHGADPTAAADSNAAIQATIDAAEAAGGGVVYFPAGLYRCDDLLTVNQSGVILRGAGPAASRIYFTRHLDMTGKKHIRLYGSAATSVEIPLALDGVQRASTVYVADASDLDPGDDIAIGWNISDAFIAAHDMTGTWQAFNGTWQPFFRREILDIDTSATPHAVTLDVPLRYPALVSDGASLRVETGYINEVGVEDLGLANAVGWDQAWANDRVHVLSLEYVKDAWVRNVASFQSPIAPTSGNGADAHLQSGGLQVHGSKRVTVADSTMEDAQDRGGGGCGYLFEIRMSSEVLFRDCVARAGRHNFIQNWGFGATGIVWLRCFSEEGWAVSLQGMPFIGQVGYSEFHHSLATANLIDSSTFHDGFKAVNRQDWSTGAGHTATEDAFWNTGGSGALVSRQWGTGYVVGTSGALDTVTTLNDGPFSDEAEGTAPEDYTEGLGDGDTLFPTSLFEDQLARRLDVAPE